MHHVIQTKVVPHLNMLPYRHLQYMCREIHLWELLYTQRRQLEQVPHCLVRLVEAIILQCHYSQHLRELHMYIKQMSQELE